MATVVDHGPGVRITGLRETVRKLERLGIETQDLKRAFGRISTTVVTDARRDVPVASGALSASIRPGNTKNKSVVRAGYAARVPYAGVINYGWPARGIRPTHFLTDAANTRQAEHVQTIEAELSRLVRSLDL